jgi:hypothetical protein
MKATLRIFVIAIVAAASAAWLLFPATAQKKSRNEFFHATAAHKKIDCASCHKIPADSARDFPDVNDYPGHASCVGCHRSDFFSGNRPAICTICHSNPSPTNGTRFPFPVRSRSKEFKTTFPHDVHQDIIAQNERPDGTVPAHFINASFQPTAVFPLEDAPPTFNNCAICHQTPAALPKYGNRTTLRGQALSPAAIDTFVPKAAFFKSAPEGHASCFSCHYQGQKPIRTDCAGCHSPASPYVESGVVGRYSLKFDHQSANHANKDCTTCHVRITQTADLASMRGADVPFLTCSTSSCHGAKLKEEIDLRDKSIANKQPAFQCAYCHAAEVGRYEIPPSHKNR